MRKETNRLLEMLSEGMLDYEQVVHMCLGAMSEDDVAQMMDANELSERFTKTSSVYDSYPTGVCPDCGNDIPHDVADGDECGNCGHVFWEEREDDDENIDIDMDGGLSAVNEQEMEDDGQPDESQKWNDFRLA